MGHSSPNWSDAVRPTLFFLAILAATGCNAGSAAVAEARLVLTAGVEEARSDDAARRAGLVEFWAARVTTAPEHPECPYELPENGDDSRVQLVLESELETAAGPRFAALSGERTRLMAEVLLQERPSTAYGREFAEAVDASLAPWPWDVTIIAHDRTTPRYTHDGVYFPGMVGGQIVVWDYELGRVVCAARVAETNSPDVIDRARGEAAAAFEADPLAFLDDDLMNTVWIGALGALRAFEADPAVPAASEDE